MSSKWALVNGTGVALVLLGAFGLGLGIRTVRIRRAHSTLNLSTPHQESGPPMSIAQGVSIARKNLDLDSDLGSQLVEETPVPDETETAIDGNQPQGRDEAEEGSSKQSQPTPPSLGDWRTIWADLNLTEEEQARLREGFRLAMERWRTLSPEDRGAEMARLRGLGEQWQRMSEQERQEASQRMRDRFEQWRRSGDVELPELSFD